MQDLEVQLRLEQQTNGRINALWPRSGFPYKHGQHGLNLLEENYEEVVRSLVFREKYLMGAKRRKEELIQKVEVSSETFMHLFV